MSRLELDRAILSGITKNNRAIVALERVFKDVGETLPDAIEAAISQAMQAVAAANQALAAIADVAQGLDQLLAAPAPMPPPAVEDYAPVATFYAADEDFGPKIQVGTIASQDFDNVDITGGTIGLFAGTVTLPSVYMVDRATGFYRIGANNWGFSVLAAKAWEVTSARHFGIGVTPITRLDVAQTGGSRIRWDLAGATVNATASNAAGAAYAPHQHNAASHVWTLNGATPKLQIDAGGLVLVNLGASVGGEQFQVSGTAKIYGDLSCNGAFGCNGKAAQTSVALGFAAGDLPTVIILANNMRAALIANGIGA